MNHKFSLLGVSLLLFISLVGAKCNRDCEEVVCQPCPNSRLRVEYVDALGNCISSFQNSAMVYGLNPDNMLDTLFSYTVSDSCNAAFLIQEDVEYHLVAGAFIDTVTFADWAFQPGVEVTECCLCYPIEHVEVLFGKDSTHVEWPVGEYENVAIQRVVQ